MGQEARSYDINKIFEVVLAFNGEHDYVKLLDIILTKMMEMTDSDAGTLYMLEEGKLHFRIIRNIGLNIFQSGEELASFPPVVLDPGNIENVCAYSAIKNEIVLVDDVYDKKSRFNFAGPKKYDKMTGYRTRSMLVMPLCATVDDSPEVIGVIQLLNAKNPKTGEPDIYGDIFNPPVIPALTRVATNTLTNIIHMRDIRDLFYSFVNVTTQAIDERSPYNKNHTQNIADYCEAFALFLSEQYPQGHPYHFSEKRQEHLKIAALLHDIGKIITPLPIMDKPDRLGIRKEALFYRLELKRLQLEIDWLSGRLTLTQYQNEEDKLKKARELIEVQNVASYTGPEFLAKVPRLAELTYKNPQGKIIPLLEAEDLECLCIPKGTLTQVERAIMQDHVVLTGRLLDRIRPWKYYADVPKWARDHHEFLDGTGYPNRLSADQIALETCIITIMDILDALIAGDRPYKQPVPIDKAMDILESMAEEGKLHKEMVGLLKKSKIWEKERINEN